MIILKIIGIIFAVLLVLVAFILALRIKVGISYSPTEKIRIYVKIFCFTFDTRKKSKKADKPKKKGGFAAWIRKKLGLEQAEEQLDSQEEAKKKSISDKVTIIVTLVTLLADEFIWLFKKMRLDRLKLVAVCSGDDAADSAMDYGLVCAAVYPMVGYLTANLNMKKNAEEIQIGCDFDGNTYFEFDLCVSVRTLHAARAAVRGLTDFAEAMNLTEEEIKQ